MWAYGCSSAQSAGPRLNLTIPPGERTKDPDLREWLNRASRLSDWADPFPNGRGRFIARPLLPLDPNGPVIAQLSSSDPNAPCYEESFLPSNVIKNEAKQFKAKTP